jgi:hypothetical protein
MLMIPAEKNSFKLQPMKLPCVSADRTAKTSAVAAATWHAKAKAVADRIHTGHAAASTGKKPLMD